MYLGTKPRANPKREKPVRSPSWLDAVRLMPCRRCHKPWESEAAHIRIGFFTRGQKPGDDQVMPLCNACHREQHGMNETLFWQNVLGDADPREIARGAYRVFKAAGAIEAERFIFGEAHDQH